MRQGSRWLELSAPQTLDEALNVLMIAYHRVFFVTGMPVHVGQVDELLLLSCDGVGDAGLLARLRLFWRYLDCSLSRAARRRCS